jgi:hypothetical protein
VTLNRSPTKRLFNSEPKALASGEDNQQNKPLVRLAQDQLQWLTTFGISSLQYSHSTKILNEADGLISIHRSSERLKGFALRENEDKIG